MKKLLYLAAAFAVFMSAGASEASLVVQMNYTQSQAKLGTVTLDDTLYGLLLTPHLEGLSPGTHGFHIHQLPVCGQRGKAAGSHFDPVKTGHHKGPYNDGHLGDLAVLVVDKNGKATLPILAPRLKLADINDRALIIHEGSDNYSDQPSKNGGGGAIVACGIIPFF